MFEEEREYFEKVVERYFEETFSSRVYVCNSEWSHDVDQSFAFSVTVESIYDGLGNCYSRSSLRTFETSFRVMANEVKKKCSNIAKHCSVDISLSTENNDDLGYDTITLLDITLYGIRRF